MKQKLISIWNSFKQGIIDVRKAKADAVVRGIGR
jgi:hypothetical protein